MVLWGRSVLGCQKVPRKVPPRFRGRFRQGSAKDSPRFHQGSTKRLQVSWCLWFSEQDPSWAAKRFRGRFHHVPPRFRQGFTKVPPRFSKFRGADPSWAAKRFRARFHQGSAEGSAKVPPRFRQGFTKVSPRFHQGFTKVPPRFHQASPSFVVSLVL